MFDVYPLKSTVRESFWKPSVQILYLSLLSLERNQFEYLDKLVRSHWYWFSINPESVLLDDLWILTDSKIRQPYTVSNFIDLVNVFIFSNSVRLSRSPNVGQGIASPSKRKKFPYYTEHQIPYTLKPRLNRSAYRDINFYLVIKTPD